MSPLSLGWHLGDTLNVTWALGMMPVTPSRWHKSHLPLLTLDQLDHLQMVRVRHQSSVHLGREGTKFSVCLLVSKQFHTFHRRTAAFSSPPSPLLPFFKALPDKLFILLKVYLSEQSSAKRKLCTLQKNSSKETNKTKKKKQKGNPSLPGQKNNRVANLIH